MAIVAFALVSVGSDPGGLEEVVSLDHEPLRLHKLRVFVVCVAARRVRVSGVLLKRDTLGTHRSSNLSSGRAIISHGVDDHQVASGRDAPWILSLNVLSAGRSASIVRSITASTSGLYTSPDSTSGGRL